MSDQDIGVRGGISIGAVGIAVLAIIVAVLMWGRPQYNVYHQHMEGKAELAKAEYNRKIAVLEAEAKMQAAKSLASAEVERARGVAEANRIIGDSLKDNESYLHYLWIDSLARAQHDVVYVPTEAGLPILEAGRLSRSRHDEFHGKDPGPPEPPR